jgi:calcineurin-like phosphoesterase family protein
MIWVTSDQHIGHKNIITYCERPFATTGEMTRSLIEGWRSCVSPRDTVICLGDMFWKKNKRSQTWILGRLACETLIRVAGNHDPRASCLHSVTVERYGERWFMSHRPPASPLEVGDASVVLCGHVHNKWRTRLLPATESLPVRFVINVSVDVWDFKPVSLEFLASFVRDLRNRL